MAFPQAHCRSPILENDQLAALFRRSREAGSATSLARKDGARLVAASLKALERASKILLNVHLPL